MPFKIVLVFLFSIVCINAVSILKVVPAGKLYAPVLPDMGSKFFIQMWTTLKGLKKIEKV